VSTGKRATDETQDLLRTQDALPSRRAPDANAAAIIEAIRLLKRSLVGMLGAGSFEAGAVASPLFEEYVPCFLRWSEAVHRPATVRLHTENLKVLVRCFSGLRLEEISRSAVEEFMMARLSETCRGNGWQRPEAERRKVCRSTVNRELTTLKLFFARAAIQYPALENPASGVRRYREYGRMRVISRDEEERYFRAVRSPQLSDVSRLILEVGPRPHEVTGLRVDDVDLTHLTLRIANHRRGTDVAVVGKTDGAERDIPLTLRAADVLSRRIAGLAAPAPDAFVFPSFSRLGRLVWLRKSHGRAVRRAGIVPAFRMYDLRHTFATRAAEKGIALPVLAAILGHSDVRMTMRYVHPQQAAMRAAIRELEGAR
jgi:integrase